MSRSYKKHPFSTDGSPKTTKENKRFANKKVRRTNNVPNGSAYKKVFPSYDIHDWVSRWTWKEAKADWEQEDSYFHYKFPTLKEFYRFWLKCCRSK